MIRGILFDLDGVLIHSTPAHRAAFEQVFQPFRISDFTYTHYAGWRTAEVVEDVFRRNGIAAPPSKILDVAAEKSRIARELLDRDRPLDPSCGAVLASLADRYALGLASSGSRSSVEAFLKWSGSSGIFSSIFSGDDVTQAKPHPESYLRSAERLRIHPSECLVIEDAVSGVEAARAMGARVVGIAGTSTAEDLKRAGAADILPALSDLPAWLASVQESSPITELDPSRWTAIIPAAGKGTRLGFHLPKILFSVAGRPILDWLLDIFAPLCGRLIFVLSPEGAPEVKSFLDNRIPNRYEVVLQETPTGMGDAVQLGLAAVQTPQVTIVWGDQVALRRTSVEACLRIHDGVLQPAATCPTVLRASPYIHFERDDTGRIVSVKQAREGDTMPATGESDTGFFCFRASTLRDKLQELRASSDARGHATSEFNLLPILPRIAESEKMVTPRIMSLEETMGINSATDAVAVEAFLAERRERKSHGGGN